MSKNFFIGSLKESVGTSMINLICFFIIILLTGACAGTNKTQTSAAVNETGQVSVKAESVDAKTSDDQEIECRRRFITGSRFKQKICATKAQWALEDSKNAKKTDSLDHELRKNDGLAPASSGDMNGGMSSGMPR